MGVNAATASGHGNGGGGNNGHHGPPPPPPPPPPPVQPTCGLFSTSGDSYLISPGNNSATAVETVSPAWTTNELFGSVNCSWDSAEMTFGQLTQVSTDVRFVQGSCWGGSPRFEITMLDKSANLLHKAFLYIGPPGTMGQTTGCPATDTWYNTGNLMASTQTVDDSQFPGGSCCDTVAGAEAKYGTWPITNVLWGTDGGWSAPQTIDFDNTQVGPYLYTYENASNLY